MKIITWNINGLRASSSRGTPLKKLLDSFEADIICLQETKLTRDQLDEATAIVDGYHAFFSFSRVKGGYSGVATYCKQSCSPFAAEEGLTGLLSNGSEDTIIKCYGKLDMLSDAEWASLDAEGRAILTEHRMKGGQSVVVINVYCPRAERENEERQNYKLNFFNLLQVRSKKLLKCGRNVMVLGDFNVSHTKLDHCDPDSDPEYFESNKSRKWIDQFLCRVSKKQDKIISQETDSFLEASNNTKVPKQESCIDTSLTENDLVEIEDELLDDVKNENKCEATENVELSCIKGKSNNVSYEADLKSEVLKSSVTDDLNQLDQQFNDEAEHDSSIDVTEPDIKVKSGKGYFIDSFRYFHPERQNAFTCWSTVTGARKTNYGTRIDYIVANKDLVVNEFVSCDIRPDIMGSDHCPVEATLKAEFVPSKRLPSLCTLNMPEFAGKQQSIRMFMKRNPGRDSVISSREAGRSAIKRKGDDLAKNPAKVPKTSNMLATKTSVEKKSSSLFKFFSKTTTTTTRTLPEVSATEQLCKFDKTDQTIENLTDGQSSQESQNDSQFSPKLFTPDSASDSSSQDVCNNEEMEQDNRQGHEESKSFLQKAASKESASIWKQILKGPEPPPVCSGHNEPCVLRTVKKDGPNYGKQFYCCARPAGHSTNREARCNTFLWRKNKR